MAKFRYVNTEFWEDEFIADLDAAGKLLFIYLLTNPLTTIAGAYRISIRRIVFDTGINRDEVQAHLGKFEDAEKAIYRDGWLLLPNFIKHQNSASPKIQNAIKQTLNLCPDWIKDILQIRYRYGIDTHAPNSNININSNSNRLELLSTEKSFPKKRNFKTKLEHSERGTRAREENTDVSKKTETAPEKKATRIPENFQITDDLKSWAKEFSIPEGINLAEVTEKFKNHYKAAKGEKALSPDWNSIWKNWMLEEKNRFLSNVEGARAGNGKLSNIEKTKRAAAEYLAKVEREKANKEFIN